MISLKTKAFNHFPISIIWFADKPNPFTCLNSQYKQSAYQKNITGFLRVPFFTKLIDLTKDLSVIEAELPPKTAYEIRRGIKDGITTGLENNINSFINFYNVFAHTKHLQPLGEKLSAYGAKLIITKSMLEGEDLVMHAYVCDHELKRIRLLHSASLFRTETSSAYKATVGRANRLLHFRDLCLFKEQGFKTYDLGGYALGTKDQSLHSINQFKDGFGGILVEESDFVPLTGVLIAFLTRFWHNLGADTWFKRKFELLFTYDRWNIGYVEQTAEDFIRTKKLNTDVSWLKEQSAAYAADPFPIEINDKLLIYYEEMSIWNGRGKLMMIDPLDSRSKKQVKGVANDKTHLSYPYLFEDNGEWYCLPETSELKELALYKIDKEQPGNLTKMWTILSGERFVDSSIIYYQNQYWLFTTHSGRPDQLFIFHAGTLAEEFHPHKLNPITMAQHTGRSAGRPFVVENKLYLPCQNPAQSYGGSLVVHEITKLNEEDFDCELFTELYPIAPYNKGLHTINFQGGNIIIDGKRTVTSPIAAIKKLSKKLRE